MSAAWRFALAHRTSLLLFAGWAFSAAMSTMPPLAENAGYFTRWAHDWLQLLAANFNRRPGASFMEQAEMAFSFNSVGHFFASGLDELVKVNGKIEAFIAKAVTLEPEVEKLTSLIPIVGPQAVVVERGVYSIAGEVAAVLKKTDPALKQHLLDAGLDQTALNAFEKMLIDIPDLWAGAAVAPVAAPVAAPVPAPAPAA